MFGLVMNLKLEVDMLKQYVIESANEKTKMQHTEKEDLSGETRAVSEGQT